MWVEKTQSLATQYFKIWEECYIAVSCDWKLQRKIGDQHTCHYICKSPLSGELLMIYTAEIERESPLLLFDVTDAE